MHESRVGESGDQTRYRELFQDMNSVMKFDQALGVESGDASASTWARRSQDAHLDLCHLECQQFAQRAQKLHKLQAEDPRITDWDYALNASVTSFEVASVRFCTIVLIPL